MEASQPMGLNRFRLAYFAYFLYLGTAGPYLSRYLEDHGIDRDLIGGLAAARIWVATLAAFAIARLADRGRTRLRAQRWCAAAGVAAVSGFAWTGSVPWLFAVAVSTGACLGPQIPLLDSGTLDALGGLRSRFGSVRYLGTVGWGAAALASPLAAASLGFERALVAVMAAFLLGYWFATLLLPDTQAAVHARRPRLRFRKALSHPALRALLIAGFLHSVAFGNYEEFSALHFRHAGASEFETSIILLIGIATEVVVFLLAPRYITDRNAVNFALCAVGIAGLRWLAMPGIEGAPALMGLQAAHGVTFGLWYAAATQIAGSAVPREVRTTGQALVAMSITAGMGAGAMLGGALQKSFGSPAAFATAASLSAIAFLVLAAAWSRFRNLEPFAFDPSTGEVEATGPIAR